MFAPHARPQMLVQPNGNLLLFFSDDGRVYETDLTTWTDRTPNKTPFSEGRADFFAAAFDSTRQRTVLFDPVEGVTWEHDAQGWRRISTSTSPGSWVYPFLDPWIRNLQELAAYSSILSYQARAPLMTFDRARNRSVMLHRDLLWEFDGNNWAQFATPAALKSCKAAMLIAFDGARSKSVVVGCNVPGQTWEWDGSAWAGPFASPFQDKIYRAAPNFSGTLQLEYTHPNALFESTTLGGVGIIDSGGTLRIWKDGTWQAGASRSDDGETQAADNYNKNRSQYVGLPTAFFPPVVEDYGANRLLWFRDGIRATRELKLLPQPTAVLPGVRVESSLDGVLEAQIHPLSLWDNFARGIHSLPRFDFDRAGTHQLERCGVTQRASYHNRECQTALTALGRSDLAPYINQGFDPQTGVDIRLQIADEEIRCSVLEEVNLKTLCSEGACNANGLCTRFEPAPVVLFHAN